MDPRRLMKIAAAILALNVLLFGVVPFVAEQVVESRLEVEASTQFGADVEADVEVLGLGALLRGEVRTIDLHVPTHTRVVDGVEVELMDTWVRLRDVRVDLGEALSGDLSEVEVHPMSSLSATVSLDVVEDLVRERLERQRPDLVPIAVDVAGANLLVTVAGPGGANLVVEARPAVIGGAIVLIPVGVRDDDPAKGLADAIAGESVALPALPYGLRIDELVLQADGALLAGDVPGVLDLS